MCRPRRHAARRCRPRPQRVVEVVEGGVAAEHDIVALAAKRRAAAVARRQRQSVIARVAKQIVEAARTAIEDIVAGAAMVLVIASKRSDLVIAAGREDPVVARRAGDDIIAIRARDDEIGAVCSYPTVAGSDRTIPVTMPSARLSSERRALARLFLLDKFLKELVSKGLMCHPRVRFGGFAAVGCCDDQHLSVNFEGPRVGSSVDLDVDRMA